MPTLDTIIKDAAGIEGAVPLILGLIAALKKTGDTRTSEEITADTLAMGAETSEIAKEDKA